MSEAVFRTVAGDSEEILEEKRSEFISAVHRVATEEEAAEFIKRRKKMHPDARHTVYAYVLRSGAARYSDDSEPQGTAGMPTLEAIRRHGLEDVVVATTRYFGGILLGAGGLTRAYAGAAHAALSAAGVAEYRPFAYYELNCTYPDYQKLSPELARLRVLDRGTDFADRVCIRLGIPVERAAELCERVVELSAGRCIPQKTGEGMDLEQGGGDPA